MKIKGDAQTSARTGIPTYTVAEDDRHVEWSINIQQLEEAAETDASASAVDNWFGPHAIVARNALRNFLGLPAAG